MTTKRKRAAAEVEPEVVRYDSTGFLDSGAGTFGPGTDANLHGSEGVKTEDGVAEAVAAAVKAAGRQPDFVWAGQPVYRCRLCGDQYERVGGGPIDALAAVLDHERSQHPTNARVSQMLGPDGRPLIVVD